MFNFQLKEEELLQRYGNRKDPLNKKENQHHKGIDIGAPMYSPIKSIMTGKVSGRGRTRNGGLYITILHSNGYSSTYRHCSKIMLEIGDEVNLDTIIAEVGMTGRRVTGPHLHLEVKKTEKALIHWRFWRNEMVYDEWKFCINSENFYYYRKKDNLIIKVYPIFSLNLFIPKNIISWNCNYEGNKVSFEKIDALFFVDMKLSEKNIKAKGLFKPVIYSL